MAVVIRLSMSVFIAAAFVITASAIWPPLAMLVVLGWLGYAAPQIARAARYEMERRRADDDPLP
jgi:hypothetical protein